MRKPGNGLECRAEPGECRQRQREHQPGGPPELAARFACRRVEALVGLLDTSLHAVQRAARVVGDPLQWAKRSRVSIAKGEVATVSLMV